MTSPKTKTRIPSNFFTPNLACSNPSESILLLCLSFLSCFFSAEYLSLVAIFQNPGDADGLEDNEMEIGNKDKHQEALFNDGYDKGPAQEAAESVSTMLKYNTTVLKALHCNPSFYGSTAVFDLYKVP